jgi:16S rRNA (cytidine1402-2'-O)-methyltransferase
MSKLYVCATPIGNLKDITLRAIETLKFSDFIICEDTRVTGKLLNSLEIEKQMISMNAFSEKKSLASLVDKITSAEVIPGASALTAALSGSGFDTSSFTFFGFLPKKKGRKTLFEKIKQTEETIVFYESPHRILKTLEELETVILDRKIGVYKEITKIHEEFKSGSIDEVLNYFQNNPGKIKGEFVVIIESI